MTCWKSVCYARHCRQASRIAYSLGWVHDELPGGPDKLPMHRATNSGGIWFPPGLTVDISRSEKQLSMTGPFVVTQNLVKHYDVPTGVLEVLRGIDLELRRGDFVAIVGASGAGQTTLLNMITAVDKSTGGEVIVGDKSVTQTPQPQLTKWRARNIGIVFQFFQLLPTISVVDNIMFSMDYADVHRPAQGREYALRWLARLGIEDQAEKRPDMLSGGQQQRTAVARALVNNPVDHR
jgi:putative ABC transport system ATP-binding protein